MHNSLQFFTAVITQVAYHKAFMKNKEILGHVIIYSLVSPFMLQSGLISNEENNMLTDSRSTEYFKTEILLDVMLQWSIDNYEYFLEQIIKGPISDRFRLIIRDNLFGYETPRGMLGSINALCSDI